jgi:hypothetical protein
MSKQQIPSIIQNKFKRELYKINEYVYFEWLGQKEYGYVIQIYQSSGTISYMVQGKKYRYPCGVQIKSFKSGTAGYIFHEQTQELGQAEIKRRFDAGTVPTVTTRPTKLEPSQDKVSRTDVSTIINEVPQRRRTPKQPATVDVQPRDNRTTKNNRTTRTDHSKLAAAIERQKSFLRKFT